MKKRKRNTNAGLSYPALVAEYDSALRMKEEHYPDYLPKFIDVLKIQSVDGCEINMQLHVIRELERMGMNYEIDLFGNISVINGYADKYICLCAHLDTVFDIKRNFNVHIRNGILMATSGGKQAGIGGDDKCGIFAILHLLERCESPFKAVFFSREETGCVGSSNFDLSFFDNVGLTIGIDRRGKSDLITSCYDTTISGDCRAFLSDSVVEYGYNEEDGLITDVFKIQSRMETPVSAVNVSCGYYNPHTERETISLSAFDNCLNFVRSVVEKYDKKTAYELVMYGWDEMYTGLDDYSDYDEGVCDSVETWLIDNYESIKFLTSREMYELYVLRFGDIGYDSFMRICEKYY